MKRGKIVKRIKKAIQNPTICRFYFHHDPLYYYYFYPVKISDKLFLGFLESDFILDGYSIRRLKDVKKMEFKDDKCPEIARQEGLVDQLYMPDVVLEDWRTVLCSLQKIGQNIIILHEEPDLSKCSFTIGRIEKVKKKSVLFLPFDADGNWYEKAVKIRFKDITCITAESRYVTVFSKYVN